jgi:hypothetical protein
MAKLEWRVGRFQYPKQPLFLSLPLVFDTESAAAEYVLNKQFGYLHLKFPQLQSQSPNGTLQYKPEVFGYDADSTRCCGGNITKSRQKIMMLILNAKSIADAIQQLPKTVDTVCALNALCNASFIVISPSGSQDCCGKPKYY